MAEKDGGRGRGGGATPPIDEYPIVELGGINIYIGDMF